MCRACVSRPRIFRLPLASGGRVFMEWHSYFGPTFYRDRACRREIDGWWDMPEVCAALEWFQERGKAA